MSATGLVMPTRVLIVGTGGREHALAWKLSAEPGVNEVTVEFTREPKADNTLTVEVQAEGYPAPLLEITHRQTATAKHVVKLQIEPKAPKDFKPVIITDAK